MKNIKEINLTITHPNILKEWDYSKNKIGPELFTHGSRTKVWWFCLKNENHQWEAIICNRIKLKGTKCPFCYDENKKCSTIEYIEKAKQIHPECLYDRTIYKNKRTEVEIGCSIHGYWLVSPKAFLNSNGCTLCYYESLCLTTEEYIIRAKEIFPEYLYDKTIYKNSQTKVIIGCVDHGYFEKAPFCLLAKKGCAACSGNKKLETIDFVIRAKAICPYYNYDDVDYKNAHIKVKIYCLHHGHFEMTPNNFFNGQRCPRCHLYFGEEFTKIVFEIIFKTKFIKIRPDWLMRTLGDKRTNLELDGYAYLDYINIFLAFEYQGRQHDEIVSDFHMTEEDLIKRKEYDQIKRNKCKEQNVKLIEIPQFNKNFKPEHLKDFIGYKCIELGIDLPEDFDQIIIDVNKIKQEIFNNQSQSSSNKLFLDVGGPVTIPTAGCVAVG